MTIPGSYFLSLILLILSLLCQGSWANTIKLTGPKWRFELYAYDFALGVLIAAALGALTFGTFGLDGFTVMDDLLLAGRRQDFFAFIAGAVFSLGNIMLLAAISLAGIAVAFPICLGLALAVGVVFTYRGHAAESPLLLVAGAAAIVAAVAFAAVAWNNYMAMKTAAAQASAAALAAEQATSPVKTNKPKKSSKRRASAGKALLLAILGGLVLSGYLPLISLAQEGENGLGPYTLVLIFAFGAVFSTFVCNLFFMNLPIQGAPVEFSQYFTGEIKDHGLGIMGGAIWCLGLLAALVAGKAEGAAVVGPALTYVIVSAAVVIAALWGLIVWKEFSDAEGTIKMLLGVALLLLVVGIGVVSQAPAYAVH